MKKGLYPVLLTDQDIGPYFDQRFWFITVARRLLRRGRYAHRSSRASDFRRVLPLQNKTCLGNLAG